MAQEALQQAELLAADSIGAVIEHWGFRKALGRIWTILYLAEEPCPAADLAERLSMSAGAVSTTLTELQRWGVVHRVWRPGERKDFFEAETDFWKMISRVVNERERALAENVQSRLAEATRLAESTPRSSRRSHMLERLRRLESFAGVARAVIDSFVHSQRADFHKFGNVLSLAREKVSIRRRFGGRS